MADFVEFLSIDFDACLKLPNRDNNHCKSSHTYVTKMRNYHKSCDQGLRKNKVFTLSSTQQTNALSCF